MKPDVLKQIKEIEEKRDQMIKEEMAKQQANGPIILQRPGEAPIQLTQQQVVQLMQQQQQQLQEMVKRSSDLETMVTNLQKQLIEKTKSYQILQKEFNQFKANVVVAPTLSVQESLPVSVTNGNISKTQPEIFIDVNA
jgi:hypothetical protein